MKVDLHVNPAPFLSQEVTTPTIMRDVIIALLPIVAASIWYFGIGALLVLTAATVGACLTEWAMGRSATLFDGSAALTGLLLGLTLPPGIPLWMAFLGGVISISLGKAIWGGLGQNLFNPALVGRAFLQAAFPVPITTWTPQGQGFFTVPATAFAAPLMKPQVDGVTGATPLNLMKFEQQSTDTLSLFIGDTAGSLGETSALLLVAVGVWMVTRRAFNWRIPVGIVATVALLTLPFWLMDPAYYPTPQFMVLSGGLLFGATFMATDPVTSPMTPRGAWLFAGLVGLLVVAIRLFGGLPEGVMYAILLGNAATPLINRWVQPRPFGRA